MHLAHACAFSNSTGEVQRIVHEVALEVQEMKSPVFPLLQKSSVFIALDFSPRPIAVQRLDITGEDAKK
jgi:hypothetical protein